MLPTANLNILGSSTKLYPNLCSGNKPFFIPWYVIESCNKCNKIFDIYDYSLKINENLKGKKVLGSKIVLEGICEEWQKKEDI